MVKERGETHGVVSCFCSARDSANLGVCGGVSRGVCRGALCLTVETTQAGSTRT